MRRRVRESWLRKVGKARLMNVWRYPPTPSRGRKARQPRVSVFQPSSLRTSEPRHIARTGSLSSCSLGSQIRSYNVMCNPLNSARSPHNVLCKELDNPCATANSSKHRCLLTWLSYSTSSRERPKQKKNEDNNLLIPAHASPRQET